VARCGRTARRLRRSVCAAARAAGAGEFVLNATAEGKPVYERNGLTQIGEGISWWLHRANLTALPND
jgi:hypothetical protein